MKLLTALCVARKLVVEAASFLAKRAFGYTHYMVATPCSFLFRPRGPGLDLRDPEGEPGWAERATALALTGLCLALSAAILFLAPGPLTDSTGAPPFWMNRFLCLVGAVLVPTLMGVVLIATLLLRAVGSALLGHAREVAKECETSPGR